MLTYHFVGIDVAKAKFDVALLIEGKVLKKIFSNEKSGFIAFAKWLTNYTDSAFICMEATGSYSEVLAEYLIAQGFRVSVVNPFQIKQFCRMQLTRNKTDALDANMIARYAEKMQPEPFEPRSEEHKTLRELTQLLETLKSQLTKLRNQESTARSKIAKKVFQKTIKELEKQIAIVEEEIKELVAKYPELQKIVTHLLEIKGVGITSIYKILAYLPDIKRFNSAKALAAFIGLSPQQKESGTYKGKTHLSKYGNAELRSAFYMPALSAKRHNEALQPFVKRLEANGLAPKAIVCAVMRKLVHIIYGMLKHNQPFNPALACQS